MGQVVDLGACRIRVPHGRTIHGRVRPKLHVVLDDDGSDLRNLFVRAVPRRANPAVAADDGAVLQDDTIPERDTLPDR
jgi:hypothetical protein